MSSISRRHVLNCETKGVTSGSGLSASCDERIDRVSKFLKVELTNKSLVDEHFCRFRSLKRQSTADQGMIRWKIVGNGWRLFNQVVNFGDNKIE